MGLFDTVRISADVASQWKLRCDECKEALGPDLSWQTKSLNPAMMNYYLRHGEGSIRLYRLDPPTNIAGRENEEGVLPAAYEPSDRRQRFMGELPHQWLHIYSTCACGKFVDRWLKFTDGLAVEIREQSPDATEF